MKILEIKDLQYKSNNTNILNGINLSVEKGDCISIVGQSGSGKSTLLKVCADLLEISKGDIFYKEINYKEYDPIELRKNISYCIQLPHLFGNTVYENLEFPFKIRNEKFNNTRVKALLESFNLDESILCKDINSLSGGEKQRISIIRNLVYTPDILLLDEATSALDNDNAKRVEEHIKQLNLRGTTVLWITHSMEQSKGIFNKRIALWEGKVQNMEVINNG
ncbi:ABC transporter ATP-binding protein [Clostridium frigidicarnis]|uniref:Putative ABC transport system ATP-binding protein n=1 Tax=Clostridium frigidicarnis TaxID=84698 RepID=A0A1I1AHU0_9CLOT|nr:ATP-binding cassette domain-containing protein [Clostridium frigidicarnis]SFB37591.1 putative ABC transport system ATP-binding protein [Clostridium frigidicarnis]